MSYKTEIRVFNDPKYYPNGVTLATQEEAEQYGQFKLATWTMAEDYRVVESDEPVKYCWDADKGLVSIPF